MNADIFHQALFAFGLVLLLVYTFSIAKLLWNVRRSLPQAYSRPRFSDFFRSLLKSEVFLDLSNCLAIALLGIFMMAVGRQDLGASFQLSSWWENLNSR